jgi:hypothetical protein
MNASAGTRNGILTSLAGASLRGHICTLVDRPPWRPLTGKLTGIQVSDRRRGCNPDISRNPHEIISCWYHVQSRYSEQLSLQCRGMSGVLPRTLCRCLGMWSRSSIRLWNLHRTAWIAQHSRQSESDRRSILVPFRLGERVHKGSSVIYIWTS